MLGGLSCGIPTLVPYQTIPVSSNFGSGSVKPASLRAMYIPTAKLSVTPPCDDLTKIVIPGFAFGRNSSVSAFRSLSSKLGRMSDFCNSTRADRSRSASAVAFTKRASVFLSTSCNRATIPCSIFSSPASLSARSLMSLACCWARESRAPSMDCIRPSSLDTKPSNTPSPMTPTTTKSQPVRADLLSHDFRRYVGIFSWYRKSPMASTSPRFLRSSSPSSSITTPMATAPVQNNNQKKYRSRRICALASPASRRTVSEGSAIYDQYAEETRMLKILLQFLAIVGPVLMLLKIAISRANSSGGK